MGGKQKLDRDEAGKMEPQDPASKPPGCLQSWGGKKGVCQADLEPWIRLSPGERTGRVLVPKQRIWESTDGRRQSWCLGRPGTRGLCPLLL